MSKLTIENATPLTGGIVHVDKAHLCDPDVISNLKQALDERGVLVFPQLFATDEEQLAAARIFFIIIPSHPIKGWPVPYRLPGQGCSMLALR